MTSGSSRDANPRQISLRFFAPSQTRAEAAYRRATADHPDAADAWNNLAQVLHETRQQQEAQTAARRAVEIGGERHAIYLATLAMIEAGMTR